MKKIKIFENFYFSNNSEIKFILVHTKLKVNNMHLIFVMKLKDYPKSLNLNIFTRVLLTKVTGQAIKANEALE